jgi:hypothetical protein
LVNESLSTAPQNIYIIKLDLEKSTGHSGIGNDALPQNIRNSNILTKKNIEQLAAVHEYPAIDPAFDDDHLKQIIQYYSISPDEMEKELHSYAKKLLTKGKVDEAWQILLATN